MEKKRINKMGKTSNNVKTALFAENFLEQQIVRREKCMTVQSYSYELRCAQDALSRVYGHSQGSLMSVSLRVGTRDNLSVFHERLKQNHPSPFTFFFDATYDASDFLEHYKDALVAEGYVVDIRERFSKENNDQGSEHFLLDFKILLTKVTFIGQSHNLESTFVG